MYKKFRIIDAHCHIYPDKIASKAVAGTDRFYDLHAEYNGTVGDLLRQGEEAGVDNYIVHSVATTPAQVESINRFIASESEKSGGALVGLGTLHPESADVEADVKTVASLGLHGVKLHHDIQHFKIDDYRCLKIYEMCEKYGLPVLMHTGDNRYDMSNPNRLIPILEIYKNMTVIGAHYGLYSMWDEQAEKLAGFPNFYVDCSSSSPFISKDTAKYLINTYGADKVLFGTDFPLYGAKNEMDYLLSLGLSDSDLQKIFSLNAERVYNIR